MKVFKDMLNNICHSLIFVQLKERKWLSIGYLDVIQSYRRSFFGPLWITLSIAIQSLSVTFIYSQLFNSSDKKEYYAYVVCGLIAWAWFSSLLTEMGNVFLSHASYLKSSNINKEQFVWAMAWKHTIIFLHNMVLWIFYWLFGALSININTLYIFITFPLVFFISLPVISVLGLLFSRYRDFARLVASLITLLLIVTPIFWRAEQLVGTRQLMFKLNPIYYLVESLRAPLMGHEITLDTWIVLLILGIFSWTILATFYVRKKNKLIFWI
jgi:ABC-type polysaccharide/polyol phosphate export permease